MHVASSPSLTNKWWCLLLLWPLMVMAVTVTAEQVANAVRSSPNATSWMRAHANEIGALAIKVESGGNTTAYNGSCCYGVLQLNTKNIKEAGFTTEQYQNASLQQQVDGWSKIQAQALRDPVIQSLQNRTTFDGQPVDASLLISCVQLGQGNCRKMVRSGRCSGFADVNGTTICSMASTMRTAIGGSSGGTPTTPPGGGTTSTPGPSPVGGGGGSAGVGSGGAWGGSGSPGAMDAEQAYFEGSGHHMSEVSTTIKMIASMLISLMLAWGILGTWAQYTAGGLTTWRFMHTSQKLVVVMSMMMLLFIWH
jgi:hypothetical protein